MKENRNPVTDQESIDRIRIGAIALPKDMAPARVGPLTRAALTDGRVDVLLVVGVKHDFRSSVSDSASALGYTEGAGQNGISVLSRFGVAGQEADLHGYPFDGFYILLPGKKPLWVLAGNTALIVEGRAKLIIKAFETRAMSHYGAPVVAAIAFDGPSEDVEMEARDALKAGAMKRVDQGSDAVQLLAAPDCVAKIQPAPGVRSVTVEGSGSLDLTAVDMWIQAAPAAQ